VIAILFFIFGTRTEDVIAAKIGKQFLLKFSEDLE
jgi:hypothetical protein